MQRSFIIKAENIALILITAAVLTFSSCSPVDKVKWGDVSLMGNDIPVWRIVNGLRGSKGSVKWSQEKQGTDRKSETVSAQILGKRGHTFFLRFSYHRDEGECRLIEYRVDGKPESPFYIYKFVSITRYRYLPGFVDFFFDPSEE